MNTDKKWEIAELDTVSILLYGMKKVRVEKPVAIVIFSAGVICSMNHRSQTRESLSRVWIIPANMIILSGSLRRRLGRF